MSFEERRDAEDFVDFLNKAVTPLHAVHVWKELLSDAGFEELCEGEKWETKPLGRYFVTKGRTTIIAFVVGGKFEPGNGFTIVTAHNDAVYPRVKPKSKIQSERFNLVGIKTYGGGFWHTWFDRDLSIAGEVVIKSGDSMVRRLVKIDTPILHIPSLGADSSTEPENDSFEFNTEDHFRPIFETGQWVETCDSPCGHKGDAQDTPWAHANHHTNFVNLIADVAETTPHDIVDMDLYLYDVEPARLGGIRNEFITGQRIDNAQGAFAMFKGFLNSLNNDDEVANDANIRVAVSFDNEEVGCGSAHGATSLFIENVLKRISIGCVSAFELGASKSMMLSVDEVHASHPNHPEKLAENHRPKLHGGICISGGHLYATTSTSHSVIKQIAAEARVPLQIVLEPNGENGGGTVGSDLAASLGILTVDLGGVELAMHSIRPMCGARGVNQAIRLYSAFYSRMSAALEPLL